MSKYEPIPQGVDDQVSQSPRSLQSLKLSICWILQAAFFLLSGTLFIASINVQGNACSSFSPHETSIYSPAQSSVEYRTQKFMGSLNYKSVYKGTPRKELDDAWDALSPGSILPGPTLAISEEELNLIGKGSTANATVQIPSNFGGGYFATLEVFHNLHCLNLVRMATYKEHYEEENAFGDHWLRKHIDHCIDMIRQRLTCTADIGLVTGVWVETYSEPYPDFSTRHVCRDFDKIRGWAMDRALNVSMEEIMAARTHISLAEPPE